jgi:hypothetical protein
VIISVEPAGTLGITQQLSNIDQLGKSSSLFLHYFYYFICISLVKEPVSLQVTTSRGVPRGDAQDARATVHPPTPTPPPGHVHPPPPQPERLVMRKDEAVGNKKKMQVCLPKHNYKLDNILLTVEPRAVNSHCFDADPDPAQNLYRNPDPDFFTHP